MRVKTQFVLLGGCAVFLALSIPAFGRPLPQQPIENPPLPAAKPKQAKQVPPPVRRERVVPVQQVSLSANAIKPRFGWPNLVVEARKYMGTNPTDKTRLWCATFMNFILAKVGYSGTNSDAAKSFAAYGRRISEPRVGAIAVLTRGKNGGHVGVVSGVDDHGNPIIISGNHNKRVGEAVYARSRVIAYVMPTERDAAPTTMVAARGPVSAPSSESGIGSPIAELIAAIEAEGARAEQPAAAPVAQRRPPAVPAVQQRPQAPVAPYRIVQQTADAPRPAMAAPSRGGNNPFAELADHLERRRTMERGNRRVVTADNGRGIR